MPGRPLTANTRAPKATIAERLQAVLITAAVGAAAGLVAGQVRLHLGLPGHKVLFWLTPVLAARLILGGPASATAGALAAAIGTAVVGGNLAGSLGHLPIIGLAGVVLDAAAYVAQRGRLAAVWAIPLMGVAGAAANLICFGKRLLAPWGEQGHALLGLAGFDASLVSYGFFGLLAGLIGSAAAYAIIGRRRRGKQNAQ